MPERQCSKCKRQSDWGCTSKMVASDETDHTATKDDDGRWWGWSNPSTLPLTLGGETVWACPRQDVFERGREWHKMLLYYGFYKKGFLPQAGAVMDQSNRAMEVFRVLDDINGECDQEETNRNRGAQDRSAHRAAANRGR